MRLLPRMEFPHVCLRRRFVFAVGGGASLPEGTAEVHPVANQPAGAERGIIVSVSL
jgi:hypothetical protein